MPWTEGTLRDLVSLQRGHDLTWRDRRDGDVPVMGSAGQNGFHDTALAKGPGIVLGRSGASFGQTHHCEKDFWPHNTALYVTDFRGNDSRFVFYRLSLVDFTRHNTGGAQQSLNRNFIYPITIPIPPIAEQRAIAEALRDVDALLGAMDQLIAKKRDLKQAAAQQLLSGQTRLPGFELKTGNKKTEIGVIPADWEVRRLLSAVRIANGQVDPKVDPYRSMTLVAPDHIESSTGRLLARVSASDQKAISGKYMFEKGDVVYSKIRPYLKKAILANFDGLCSADMYPLKPSVDVSADFMLAALLGRRFSEYAESVSVRSGMPKINRAELADYSFALPPFPEQQAIAAVFSDMDAELASLERHRDKMRTLKQGMMQELLTGKTRLI